MLLSSSFVQTDMVKIDRWNKISNTKTSGQT